MTSWGCCSLCSKHQNVSDMYFILCVFGMLTHRIAISIEKYMINAQFLDDINSSGAISNFRFFTILFWLSIFFFLDLLFAVFVFIALRFYFWMGNLQKFNSRTLTDAFHSCAQQTDLKMLKVNKKILRFYNMWVHNVQEAKNCYKKVQKNSSHFQPKIEIYHKKTTEMSS